MAQQNDSNVFAAALPDRAADPVAIFSAPDVVFHWWVESKRRWAEQNRASKLTVAPLVAHASGYAPSGDSE